LIRAAAIQFAFREGCHRFAALHQRVLPAMNQYSRTREETFGVTGFRTMAADDRKDSLPRATKCYAIEVSVSV